MTSTQPKPAAERLLWGVSDVAESLGWSKPKVRKWVAAGKLPAKTIGGRLQFDACALREWVRGQFEPPKVEDKTA